MVRPAIGLANDLAGHFRNLEKTRNKMERLMVNGSVVRRDIEQVYAGLYLDALTQFERMVETLFLGLLVGRLSSSLLGFGSRISVNSDQVARDVVFATRRYVDWLPYDSTEERAKLFFRNGLPFTSLDSAEKSSLTRVQFVRNAIARKSRYAIRQFETKVVGESTLMPRERTPTGYLRSTYRAAPAQTRYNELVGHLASVAIKLCQ